MKNFDFLAILKTKWETLLISAIIGATFGLYINFFLPHYFRASGEFLITQKQSSTLDAYTAIKGSEQLAYTLKQVIYSPAFFDQVLRLNFNINTDYFGREPEKIMKRWRKTILVSTFPNTGILKINIFHPNKAEAQRIGQATAEVISKNYQLFLGENHQINIIPLSKTIVSNRFVRPNALTNTVLGFILGLSSGFVFAVVPLPRATVRRKKVKSQRISSQQKKIRVPNNLPIA